MIRALWGVRGCRNGSNYRSRGTTLVVSANKYPLCLVFGSVQFITGEWTVLLLHSIVKRLGKHTYIYMFVYV